MNYCDFHNDIITADCDWYKRAKNYYRSRNLIVLSLFYNGNNEEYLYKVISKHKKEFYFGLENCCYGSLAKTEEFFKFKPIYASLTWNQENQYSYGCDNNDGILKPLGKEVILNMNNYGVALDVAHLSRKAFYEAIEYANCVVDSHTCLYSLRRHKRNITDEQALLIIKKGGIIGLCLYAPFLNVEKFVTVEDVVRHIDYFTCKFGYKNLCLGTDFYGAENFALNCENYKTLCQTVEKLIKLGYNKKVLISIFNDNLKKFLIKRKRILTKIDV